MMRYPPTPAARRTGASEYAPSSSKPPYNVVLIGLHKSEGPSKDEKSPAVGPSNDEKSPAAGPSRVEESLTLRTEVPPTPDSAASSAYTRGLQQNVRMFPAVANVSSKGIHPVLRYDIPGGNLCYTFMYQRTNARCDVYLCAGCRKLGTRVPVPVLNGEFFTKDPGRLPHVCSPWKSVEDEVKRLIYKACQEACVTPECADKKPRQLYQEIDDYVDIHYSEDPSRREEMLNFFHRNGYKARRTTLARALRRLRKHRTTLEKMSEQGEQGSETTSTISEQSPETTPTMSEQNPETTPTMSVENPEATPATTAS
uniref:Uncharacterized protein n=1 Tax=Haemonchus contortus TaxID=6289 RepID=A0A7I4Y2X5_HAECO